MATSDSPAAAAAAAVTASKAKTATLAAKILRQKYNVQSAKYFAAGISGLILLFMIFHWTRVIYKRFEVKISSRPGFLKIPVDISRAVRSVLLRKVPGFTSTGHALMFIGYFGTCLGITFFKMNFSNMTGISKRLGWVAICSFALVTFLSLKNTPLAFLTGYSYERLNVLHQVAGYSTVFCAMLHAVLYIITWAKSNSLHELTEEEQVVGIAAGFAFLTILLTSLFLRRLRYEVFYIVHIVMFMFAVVLVGFHRPDFAKKTVIITIVIGSIWVADRTLRFAKVSYFSIGNTATVTPLPHGGTRIVLKKSPSRAIAGDHCFLWIPGVRAAETHPFTIVSTNPLEFVIASYDGFTRDLHAYAQKYPGKALKASIDGPYGVVPDYIEFTKVLFIAGGSGASYTLGVALELVRKLGTSTRTSIEIIWAMRENEMIEWYAKELGELRASPLVTISIHSTRSSSLGTPTSRSNTSLPLSNSEKRPEPSSKAAISSASSTNLDIEKQPGMSANSRRSTSIQSGRPNISSVITSLIDTAEPLDRIAVAACGPDSLMAVTRRTVAACVGRDGAGVELFCEQFGF